MSPDMENVKRFTQMNLPKKYAQIRKWSKNPLLITAVKAGYEMIALFYIKSILTEFGTSTNLEI